MANDKILGCGFHHVALQTKDLERSLKFYIDGLGFTLRAKWRGASGKEIALVDIGNGSYFELFSDGEPKEQTEVYAGTFFHLALSVSDTRQAFARAVACGGVPHVEPKEVALGEHGELLAALSFVLGPDGEQIEFFEEHA